jgi:hypothetical protein
MKSFKPTALLFISMGFCFNLAYADNLETQYLSDILGKIPSSTINKKSIEENGAISDPARSNSCLKDELLTSALVNSVLKEFKYSLESGKIFVDYPQLVKRKNFPIVKEQTENKIDDIEVQSVPLEGFSSSAKKYFSNFQIKEVNIDVIKTISKLEDRNDKFEPTKISFLSQFNFRGYSKKAKRQDRGLMGLHLEKSSGKWVLASVDFKSLQSLKSNKIPTYRKISSVLDKVPVELRTEAIRRGGYALANSDVNADGYVDILVATKGGVHLYMGSKDRGFELSTSSGLENLTYVKTAVFADLNNSGVKDLVLTRLVNENKKIKKWEASVYVYKGDGKGKFSLVKDAINTKKTKYLESMPATVADFNGDGKLDIYVGYPGVKDFTANDNGKVSGGFSPQGVYLNKGNYKFQDFTDKFIVADYGSGKIFPHASLAANFNQEKGVDLLVIDDRGNLSPAFINTGNKFDESADSIGIGNRAYGMSIGVGDTNNDGITDIIFTNVNMVAPNRMVDSCDRQFGHTEFVGGSGPGLRLFRGNGVGFDEVKGSGLEDAGYGAAGVVFIDYNHDGWQDIYLVNGLWSGTNSGDELDSLFSISTMTLDVDFIHPLKEEAFGGFKDFLYKAVGKFDYEKLKWKAGEGQRPSLAGFQRNRLFRNNGNGQFTEVGYFEGLDSIADGYVVTKVDINHDGVEDLVLRNADPGVSENLFAPVEAFVNQSLEHKKVENQITFEFERKGRSKDGFGSFIVINMENGSREVHHMIANSGAAQDESKIRIYLGQGQKVKNAEIHWTSGKTQSLPPMLPGYYLLKEGKDLVPVITSI